MVLTKWSDKMTIKFVSLYKQHECLWKIESQTYRDREARNLATLTLMHEMNLPDFTAEDVRRKIKHLRSTYIIEVHKIEKANRAGKEYRPRLCWFDDMHSFLDGVTKMKIKNRDSTMEDPHLLDDNYFTNEASYSHDEGDENDDPLTEQKPKLPIQLPPVKVPKKTPKKRKASLDIDADSNSEVPIEFNSLANMAEDEFDIFGKHIAVQLRSLPLEQAIIAQEELQSVVTKYRLNAIRKGASNSSH